MRQIDDAYILVDEKIIIVWLEFLPDQAQGHISEPHDWHKPIINNF